jgi:hypothetical protein
MTLEEIQKLEPTNLKISIILLNGVIENLSGIGKQCSSAGMEDAGEGISEAIDLLEYEKTVIKSRLEKCLQLNKDK